MTVAAQGFILGPNLWNVSCDSVLWREISEVVFLVGYEDDVAAVILVCDVETVQINLNEMLSHIKRWMEHLLKLTAAKSVIVVLTKM